MKHSILDSTLWGTTKQKIAVLVPTRDLVHSHFSYSLTQMVKFSTQMGLDVYTFFDSSTVLLNQRNNLVNMGKELGADYFLWLDSDMIFPTTTLTRLLSHNKDIVGCNYMKRSLPLKPTAYLDTTDWNTHLPLDTTNDLVEVEAMGMGCVLTKSEVFTNLEKPYFKFTYDVDTDDYLGEDFNLFKELKEYNYKIYVDTNLSKEIKHLGTFAF
jgi:hypothetical protein